MQEVLYVPHGGHDGFNLLCSEVPQLVLELVDDIHLSSKLSRISGATKVLRHLGECHVGGGHLADPIAHFAQCTIE